MTDNDGAVAVRGLRFADDARWTVKQLLAAVDPPRAVAQWRVLPADHDAAVTRHAVGAAAASLNGAAEIDHAGGLLPPERACDAAAIPRQADDHRAIVVVS